MIDEHQGQCIYENGRFRLREETDYAIIDELEDFPPIMVQMEETNDGSESQYADRRGVLHLMNQLADTNPNEQRHFYLKYRLDKLYGDNDLLRKENEQLKQQVEDLYESDKSLRKFASNMTLNYTGICVPRRLFDEVLNILKDMEHNDLVEDLSKESIDTSANGC